MYWMKRFQLGDWSLIFQHAKIEPGMVAKTLWNASARNATIILSTNIDCPSKSFYDLKETALHEVLHIVLAGLVSYTQRTGDSYVSEEEHRIINHMIKALQPT